MTSFFEKKFDHHLKRVESHLPPTPPETEDNVSNPEELYTFPLPPPSTRPTKVLDIDKNTPDAHVPRDARLIRLTGVHPFNVEPPLSALYDEGNQQLPVSKNMTVVNRAQAS